MLRRTALLSLIALTLALSCREIVPLPPVEGPPLTVPEGQEGPPVIKQAPLSIIFATPEGQLDSPHLQITVSFSRPMVSLSKVEDQARLSPLKLTPEVAGKQRWLGTRTLIFEPDKPLAGSTEYKAEIPAGIKATDGAALKQGKAWTFTTPRLSVAQVTPHKGARWQRPDTTVRLRFNQPVEPAAVEKIATLTTRNPHKPKAPARTLTLRALRGKDTREVVINPRKKLPLDSTITLTLQPGLLGTEGPLPTVKAWTTSFKTYGPLRVTSISCSKRCDPEDSIRVEFSNPVPFSAARAAVRLNDKALSRRKANYTTRSIYVDGKLDARKAYKISIKAGLKDKFGQRLASTASFNFVTGDYHPFVYFPISNGVLEAGTPLSLPVNFRNADRAILYSKKLSEAEVARLLGHSDWWDDDKVLLDEISGTTQQVLKVSGSPNKRLTRRVDLAPMLGIKKLGMVGLELSSRLKDGKERRSSVQRAVVRVTDLAMTAKYSPHGLMLWVTSLSAGTPVAGADVAVWRTGGDKALWRGKTDAGGLALVRNPDLLGAEEDRRLLFFASKDGDQSYVSSGSQGGISPWDFGLDATWDNKESNLIGVLFTDRGLYRPGEGVFLKGVIRRDGRTGLVTPPAGSKVKLTINDSRGEKLEELSVPLSEFGTLAHKVELPAGAPLGSYSVVAKPTDGGTVYGRFSVEEFRPAEFKVSVKSDKPQRVRGETMKWEANGAYLFGAPMRGAPLTWSIYSTPSYYRPPGHDGFVFSDRVWWFGEGSQRRDGGFVARGSGKLDAQGGLWGQQALKPAQMTGPISYELETSVTDISRQSISSRTMVLLHPGEVYVGARPEKTFLKAGETLSADLLAVSPKGKAVAGIKLMGTLFRRVWTSVRKKGMGGAHYFVSRPKETKMGSCGATSSDKPAPCKIKVPSAGYYVLRLAAKDGRGNQVKSSFGLYATGPDYVPWRRDNDDKVELVTDRETYKVGQRARILVKSPYADAHGLLTVERNGIYMQQTFKLKSTAAWLDVPITPELQPNAYVSVVLVRGRVKGPTKKTRGRNASQEDDAGKPTFKVGYAQLKISNQDRRLAVTVSPDKTDYRPGGQVTLDLQVQDHAGKAVKAEMTVVVADEGVLSLVGYKLPDLMGTFYAARGLSVRTADNRLNLLDRRVFGEKGKGPGGGGGESGAAPGGGARSKFVSTPYFNPAVLTDDQGKARVTFKLPDNLTTFRVMAAAVSSGAEFGNARGSVRVNKPLLLLPTLPRFMRVGDAMDAGVVVHNDSARAGKVKVSAKVTGVELTGPASQDLDLAHKSSGEAVFRFKAARPGTATFTFTATLGDLSDSLELKRPVKLPLVMETVTTYGSTDRAVAEGVLPGAGVRDDVGGLQVDLSSSAMVGLKGGMEYLLDYPYECLEQSVSRMVPLVLLKDLGRAYGLEQLAAADGLVARLIARVQKLQRWDGGFSYWPSSNSSYPWASAYAAWGLTRAKALNHKVSPRVLDKAKGYLKKQLRWRKDKDETGITLATHAYMAYVLTEMGEKAASDIATLFERREKLPLFGRALLLSALVKGGGAKEMIDPLVMELLNKVQQTAKEAKVEENLGDGYAPLFHSSTRSTAMVLDALLGARPDHPLPEKMVRHLLDKRKEGHWRNTQETVYALLALHRYFQAKEQVVPDFVAKIFLGDKKLLEQPFKGRTLEVKRHTLKMAELRQATAGKGPLGLVKDGAGRLYYSASLRYARATLPVEPYDGGFFVTRSYQAVAGGGDMASLRGIPGMGGEGVTKVKAGDLVRVTLRIIVPQHMFFVAVDDPLPAGLEAVNFRLMTTARHDQRLHGQHGYQARYGKSSSRSYYSPFYQQTLRDDGVQLFSDSVMPGVYFHVYLARATTSGSFVTPPTHVEQMYAPETFGRTGAVTFEVTR